VWIGSGALLLGCQSDPSPASDGGLPEQAPASPALATAAPMAETHAPDQPDPQALVELLAATPSGRPPATGPDGKTLVGTETGFQGDAGSPATAARAGTLGGGCRSAIPRSSRC